ncbi:MAG: Smr/MutS family protein [Pseudomonadota bacterium]
MGKKEKDDIFNPAFKGLRSKIDHSQERPTKPDIEESEPEKHVLDDELHFLEAMADVTPLIDERKKIVRETGMNIRPTHPAPDDQREALAHLHELVKGFIDMDITFSDEYMEGSVKGLNRKVMRRLKKGQVPYQDYVDLHGLTRQDAETKVLDFLIQSCRLGHRCVLIVHGRGLNSPDCLPVLKERLPVWLNRGPAKKIVLAFATAQPYDGGTGAIYVLLKR